MRNLLHSRVAAVSVGAAVIVGLGTSGAVAADLMGSGDIKNQSIRGVDIAKGAIDSSELRDRGINGQDIGLNTIGRPQLRPDSVGVNQIAPFVMDKINSSGSQGDVQGLRQQVNELKDQLASQSGDSDYTGANWSVVDRNVIGAGDAELRPGPSWATADDVATPPYGDGSLGIRTASGTDKAAFGNQADFAGDLVSGLSQLSYWVFTTGENNGAAPNNMPSITFEIDPNLETSDRGYSSMVFAPNNSAANQWTKIDAFADDANGKVWGLTGADMPCNINGARCTWSELQAALNDGGEPATILTVQITKGRDYAFSGAVDGLQINDTVYDFEPTGVQETTEQAQQ